MNSNEMRSLFAYNDWANARLITDSRVLTLEQLTAGTGTSFHSILGTFVHIFWAEWVWFQRWNGDSPKRKFSTEEFEGLDAVQAQWRDVEEQRILFLDSLTDEQLQRRISYENLQGERWEYTLIHAMQHTANHSTYHRGQIAALLRQAGTPVRSTDFLIYCDELGQP